jgi:RND family efflux transporter MFP subunit
MKTIMIQFLGLSALLSVATSCGRQQTNSVENAVTVRTIKAQSAGSQSALSYPGTIEELNGTSLSFATAGTIKQLRVSEGQWVKAGEVLGVVDPTRSGNALTMARSATRQALDTQKQAEDAYRRMKILHDRGSLPEIKWVEVETKLSQAKNMVRQAQASEQIARKGVSDTRLVAPFSGYISTKTAEVGQNVMPGVPVAKLVKIDQVKVKISVPEGEMSKMRNGRPISFTVPSLDNRAFTARITEKGIYNPQNEMFA